MARPLVLPKGWLEVGLSADTKRSTQYRGGDGELRAHPDGLAWRYSRLWFELRQGFSDRVTLYGRVPVVDARLDLAMGSQISSTDVGDARLGVVVQPWLERRVDAGFSVELKTPTGVEWPEGTGGPGDTHGFLTGTGTTDLAAHLHGQWTILDRVKLGADVGYVHQFAAIVGYVEEVGGFGNGVMDPGNEVLLRGSVMGKVVRGVSVSLAGRYRSMGGNSKSASTAMVSASFGPSRPRWRLVRCGGHPQRRAIHSTGSWRDGPRGDLAGGDTPTLCSPGLGGLRPQPGWTFGSRVAVRW